MRSRRTGSRSISALPPTLPPAISTCARRYVKFENPEEVRWHRRRRASSRPRNRWAVGAFFACARERLERPTEATRGRLGRRRRPSRDARRRLGAGARVTRRSRAAARGGGARRGSRTREARYLRRCCESNCPLKDLRAALQRVRAGRRGSSSSAWVRSVAALWPWSTAPRFCGVDGRRPRSFCALRFF